MLNYFFLITLDTPYVHDSALRSHLAHGGLNDGIEASLRGVTVPGHNLLLHLLREATHLLCQRQNVFVSKLRQTGGVYTVDEAGKKNSFK